MSYIYIPSIITSLNVFLGIFSLYLISTGRVNAIFYMIFVTAFLDFADGYLARRLNAETRFGCILDSASDIICFAIVPAFFVFMVHNGTIFAFLISGCLFYLMAGIIRLYKYTLSKLRYNSSNGAFLGCPVTAAALCVVLSVNIYQNTFFNSILLFICGFFMISNIEYTSLSNIVNKYGSEVLFLIGILLLAPFLVYYPRHTMFALSCAYLSFFPLKYLWSGCGHGFMYPGRLMFALAKGARRTIGLCFAFTVISILFLPLWLKISYTAFLSVLIFFFRDPERSPGRIDTSDILAPADGKVIGVRREFSAKDGKFMNKISIFLSLFDVHVTRAPAASRVIECRYFKGGHLDARRSEAAGNEHFLYALGLRDDTKIYMRQIAGKFARRIKSYVNERDFVNAADKMGIILFGSRVELLLPDKSDLYVKTGDTVKAGITVIGNVRRIKADTTCGK